MRTSLAKIAKAKDLAAGGVDFSPQNGAGCPWCRRPVKIVKTMPWQDNMRIRYHRCQSPGCVLSHLAVTIKSVEIDAVMKRQTSIVKKTIS